MTNYNRKHFKLLIIGLMVVLLMLSFCITVLADTTDADMLNSTNMDTAIDAGIKANKDGSAWQNDLAIEWEKAQQEFSWTFDSGVDNTWEVGWTNRKCFQRKP